MSLLLLLLGSGAGGGPTVVTPTGLEATGGLGTPVISVTTAASGLFGTASVGTPNPTTTASATATPSGLEATSALGTPVLPTTVTVSGLAATATRGTPVVSATVVQTGLEASAAVGTPAVSLRLLPTGLVGTGSLGTVVASASIVPAGVGATAANGTPVLSSAVAASGLGGTSAVGVVPNVPGRLMVAGLAATSSVGTATTKSVVVGSAAPTTERWLAPRLPTDDRMIGILQSSLDRLERTQGRAPVVMTDRRVTSATTLVDSDGVMLVDCTAGGVTVTLPPASSAIRGRSWAIKKIDGTANNVTLAGAGTDTIDGSATYAWNTQYKVVWVQCALVTPPGTYGWVVV